MELEQLLKRLKRNPFNEFLIMEVSKKIEFIKDWILNYVDSMPKKTQSLIIGISGGIDSSVTSTLCAMTGKKNYSINYAN